MDHTLSPLEKAQLAFKPPLPLLLEKLSDLEQVPLDFSSQGDEIKSLFPKTFGQRGVHFIKGEGLKKQPPLKVGVILSGGQAAGGHNVIIGLFDALKAFNEHSTLIGFLNGPQGVIENQYKELTEDVLARFRNTGGFDLIGSGRTKIATEKQLTASLETCRQHDLNALVIIGGDDSNTNAAILAEVFLGKECKTQVIGVPKTIDGDLKNQYIESSFGFDTACKIYSEMIGNICRDALSAKKYTHFIKLMGRSASHIAIECALQTHPNLTIIGEEISFHNTTLLELTLEIANLIEERAKIDKHYGVILIPEGLIEFIPEMKKLIEELNPLLALHASKIDALPSGEKRKALLWPLLSQNAQELLNIFPETIINQLLLDRDPHGNIQVSHIETEKLLIATVRAELTRRGKAERFSPVAHFFGYEGRCGFPSFFDATYCNALGRTAALLINHGLTGYLSCLQNLQRGVDHWVPCGVPITDLLVLEERKGKRVPVIEKAFVDLKGMPFGRFAELRKSWGLEDNYRYPGPIQFFGPKEIVQATTLTLSLEHEKAPTTI